MTVLSSNKISYQSNNVKLVLTHAAGKCDRRVVLKRCIHRSNILNRLGKSILAIGFNINGEGFWSTRRTKPIMGYLNGRAGRRDWSELPPELLQLISERVEEIGDYVRFGAVCKSWLSAASPHSNLGPQIPWMLLPYDTDDTIRRFFSPSSRRTYRFDLPSFRGCIIYNSPGGWLLMADASLSFSVLNPFSRERIHLPPLSTYEFYDSYLFAMDNLSGKTRLLVIPIFIQCYQFILAANEFLIVLVLAGFELLYCRVHDKAWIRLIRPSESLIRSVSYYGGRIFTIQEDGKVSACELSPQANLTLIPSLSSPVETDSLYLVAVANKLLMVTISCQCFDFHECLKLDVVTQMKWLKIQDIGGHTLFFTPASVIAVAVNKSSGCRRNCVYVYDTPDLTSPIQLLALSLNGNTTEQRIYIKESVLANEQRQLIWFTPSLC